jgi:hypothetical protein
MGFFMSALLVNALWSCILNLTLDRCFVYHLAAQGSMTQTKREQPGRYPAVRSYQMVLASGHFLEIGVDHIIVIGGRCARTATIRRPMLGVSRLTVSGFC